MKTEKNYLQPKLYKQESYYKKVEIEKIYLQQGKKEKLEQIILYSYNTCIACIFYRDVYPRYSIKLSLDIKENKKLLTQTTKKHLRDFYFQYGNINGISANDGHILTLKEINYLLS